MLIDEIMAMCPENEFLIADGFNEACIGYDDKSMRLIYSVDKCINILMRNMTMDEAREYFEYNVGGAYMGDKTPIWCQDDF